MVGEGAQPTGLAADLLSVTDRAIAEYERRASCLLRKTFPDSGPYGRLAYPKHLEWFAAGAQHRERLLIAANRVGKTWAGAYEVTLHLTGLYPAWWEGRRFEAPVQAWAAGDTSKTARDILQAALLGPPGRPGEGMIPVYLRDRTTAKSGVPDAVESVWVAHYSPDGVQDGISVLDIKSYDQRREAFQGTSREVVWLDEEPPEDIYTECLLRTAQTSTFVGGMLMLTFTPLMGLTPLVLSFLPGGRVEPGAGPSTPTH